MGPDEFHDGYLDRPGEGVRDNVYTNVMTAWVLRRAIATVDLLRRHPGGLAWKRLDIASGEPDQWDRIARRLTVVFNDDGTLSQFDGYEDPRAHRPRRVPKAYPMDRQARPHPQRRGGHDQPVSGVEAARRTDAAVPVLR